MKFLLSKWSSLTLVIITAIFLVGASDAQFDFSFEKFFQKNDPNVEFYNEFKNNFEDDSRFLLLGLKNGKSIYDSVFLSKVNSLTQTLEKDTFFTEIYSPSNAKRVSLSPLGDTRIPLFNFNSASRLKKDSIYLDKNPHFKNVFVSENGQSVCLTIKVIDGTSREEVGTLLEHIRTATENLNFDYHLAGKLVAEEVYIDKTKKELSKFSIASLVLIVLFLTITYRSFWLLVIPLGVIGLSVLWSIGFMSYTGKGLDLLMSLLPSIMFVVGMSDVIHFLSKYIEELRKGQEKQDAIKATVKEIGTATLLTSVTTAIGFFSLYFIEIAPIREFGIYIGFGVLFAFIITILLLPKLLQFLPEPKVSTNLKTKSKWNLLLSKLLSLTLNKKALISTIFVGVTVISLIGIDQVRINSKLIDDLRPNDPIKLDFLYFEDNFFGTRPFEISLTLGEEASSFFDFNTQKELDKLTNYLSQEYGVKNIVSPLTFTKTINQSTHSGLSDFYTLPDDKRIFKKLIRYMRKAKKRPEYGLIINDSLNQGRLTGKLNDLGSFEVSQKNEALYAFIEQNINPKFLKTRLTGSALLIDANNRDLAQNMLLGLLTAFVIIAVIMGGLFKSLRMIIIALIPNIIPLCILGGILGYGAIDLKLSTSIIFTVAFGIAVDDTIHFMSRYKMEKAKGLSKIYAIKRSFMSTGKALIVTSFILSAGFMCLMMSSFMGTFYTGLFVSLTLVFALLSDLLFLPILLLIFDKDSK